MDKLKGILRRSDEESQASDEPQVDLSMTKFIDYTREDRKKKVSGL
jgi:hypothetical protein